MARGVREVREGRAEPRGAAVTDSFSEVGEPPATGDVTLLITDHPAWLHALRTEHCAP